ncbi:uncharacterized protein LOC132178909 [Corylus avellana]|uniref:uncharacterized protein LOC132178909 n=1 Tax=Corylus avellana TaxID=13451 RepID=UPI00286AB5C8|nr:uncharacterized protein LOC132178909 [Corylus avellana]
MDGQVDRDLEIQIKEAEVKLLQQQLELMKLKQKQVKKESSGSEVILDNRPTIATEEKGTPNVSHIKAEPQSSQEETVEIPTGKYYVVYNGPSPGVYTSWSEASKFVTGLKGIIHKSFPDRKKAYESLGSFRIQNPELLTPADILKDLYQSDKPISKVSSKLTLASPNKIIVNQRSSAKDKAPVIENDEKSFSSVTQKNRDCNPNQNAFDALRTNENRLTSLGKIPVISTNKVQVSEPEESTIEESSLIFDNLDPKLTQASTIHELSIIKPETWFRWSNLARSHKGESVMEDCFYTTDKSTSTGSKFNFIAGADPKMVYQTYLCGLIDNIYPHNNLVELTYFPDNFKKAIKNFRKKIKAQDRPVFLKFYSSTLDWDEEGNELNPYHLVKIGIASEKRIVEEPTVLRPRPVNPYMLHQERAMMLSQINFELKRINANSQVKVNYASPKVLMISQFPETISEADAEKVINFEQKFNDGRLDVSNKTSKLFCRHAKKQDAINHNCRHCESKELAPSTSDEKSLDGTELMKTLEA